MTISEDSLDALGIREGTDKSSLFNDYLRHYDQRFATLRGGRINIIEIGIGSGGSLRMWRSYFPEATIIGVDIDLELAASVQQRLGDAARIFVGSQDDPDFLSEICARFPPTIVIDDGSHFAKHMLFTFQHVFPLVAPGGWYVIEDLWIAMEMTKIPITPHQYLADIAAEYVSLKKSPPPSDNVASLVESVEFVPGACFVRKNDDAADVRRLLAAVPAVEESTHSNNWHWLAQGFAKHGLLDRAEDAARRAVALREDYALYQSGLSEILERQGRMDEALDYARSAAELDRETPLWQTRYRDLLARLGR